jgi:hypothetical protein
MIREMFGEESMSYTWVFEWKSPNSPSQKKGEAGEEQIQEHAHHFFHIKEIVHTEFILAGQTIETFYSDCIKCAKTSPQILAAKELPVASWQCTI